MSGDLSRKGSVAVMITEATDKVFVVESLSNGLWHLGDKNKIPLCGRKLLFTRLTTREIRFFDLELKEHWKSELQGDKWVIVQRYYYCKKCLSILKGRMK